METITYKQWQENKLPQVNFGVRLMITDKLRRTGTFETLSQVGKLAGDAISRAIWEKGYKPPEGLIIEKERDAALRGTDVTVVVKCEFDPTPEKYLYYVSQQWRNYEILWEMNLWQHIKFWWVHRKGGK